MAQSAHVSASSRGFEMPFGTNILPDGRVQFRLWAPSAKKVDLVVADGSRRSNFPMWADGNGWYSTVSDKARAGALYQFHINDEISVPDPASKFQPNDVHGPSMV